MFDLKKFLEDNELEIGEMNGRGWAQFEECPGCKEPKVAGILVDEENSKEYGKYRCFRASCGISGDIFELYMLVTGSSFPEAKKAITGKNDYKKGVRYKISQKMDKIKSKQQVTPRESNPFFIPIEEGDFAFNYLLDRGYAKEFILERKVLKSVRDTKEEFRKHIKATESEGVVFLINMIRKIFNKSFPTFEKVVTHKEFENALRQDVFRAYSAVEAYRLCGRVIIPCYYNRLKYGYVARACFGQEPKTINPSGIFSSELMGDWDIAKKSMRIIINEGWADSWACGDSAVYLYGTGFKHDSLRFKLLSMHPCSEIAIYLDPGAERSALKIYEIIASSGKNVAIVNQKNDIEVDDNSREYCQKLVGMGFNDIKIDDNSIVFPVYLYQALQIAKLTSESKEQNFLTIFNKSNYSSAYKKKVINSSKVLSEWKRCSEYKSIISYLDAGDRSVEENLNIVDESIKSFDIIEWKIKNGFEL